MDSNKWTFGSKLLKMYLTTFSYDEKKIIFNSENKILFYISNQYWVPKKILVINILLLCLMLLYLIFSKYFSNFMFNYYYE